jgi:aminoglycoside phosphotransferase
MALDSIVGLAQRILPKVTGRIVQTSGDPDGQCAITTNTADLADSDIKLLAKGGYNDVWLVTPTTAAHSQFVLRVPNEESLIPHQIRNEVGWLRYMAKHCPEIPVPAVFAYSDGAGVDAPSFIAQEYVQATALSEAWTTFTETEKEQMALALANLVVCMGECRFDAIGGMTPEGILGPTVEGVKLFKGRSRFHDANCYNIGPYSSIKEYISSYYDKEIYYHVHADDSMLDEEFFETTSALEWAEMLKAKKQSIETDLEQRPLSEPLVLCHGDLQGRNILVRGTTIVAVIDWEFAGSYPLSELDDGGIEVLEMVDEQSVEECFRWSIKISDLVVEVAEARGWTPDDVKLLKSGGCPDLQAVRVEMVPEG